MFHNQISEVSASKGWQPSQRETQNGARKKRPRKIPETVFNFLFSKLSVLSLLPRTRFDVTVG